MAFSGRLQQGTDWLWRTAALGVSRFAGRCEGFAPKSPRGCANRGPDEGRGAASQPVVGRRQGRGGPTRFVERWARSSLRRSSTPKLWSHLISDEPGWSQIKWSQELLSTNAATPGCRRYAASFAPDQNSTTGGTHYSVLMPRVKCASSELGSASTEVQRVRAVVLALVVATLKALDWHDVSADKQR